MGGEPQFVVKSNPARAPMAGSNYCSTSEEAPNNDIIYTTADLDEFQDVRSVFYC